MDEGTQRADTVEDLIEEILRMDLLHHLAIDSITDAKQSIPVDPIDRCRQRARDAGHQPSIFPIEGPPRAFDREGAPCAAPPADRANDEVISDRRIRVADVSREQRPIPPDIPG